MTDRVRVWSSRPALCDPRGFVANAVGDLARAIPIASHLAAARFKARHRRAALGYVWIVLPAIALTLAVEFVRANRIVAIGETGLPYAVFVLCGLFLWQGFVEAVSMPVNQLREHRRVLDNVPLHEAVLVGGAIDLAVNMAVRLALLYAVLVAGGLQPHATWALLPLAGLAMLVAGLAIGLWIAPPGLLYDDVARALPLAATLGIAVTPVFYPLPRGSVLGWNPLAPLVEGARAWIGGDAASGAFWAILCGAAVLSIGGWLFHRAARPHLVGLTV